MIWIHDSLNLDGRGPMLWGQCCVGLWTIRAAIFTPNISQFHLWNILQGSYRFSVCLFALIVALDRMMLEWHPAAQVSLTLLLEKAVFHSRPCEAVHSGIGENSTRMLWWYLVKDAHAIFVAINAHSLPATSPAWWYFLSSLSRSSYSLAKPLVEVHLWKGSKSRRIAKMLLHPG